MADIPLCSLVADIPCCSIMVCDSLIVYNMCAISKVSIAGTFCVLVELLILSISVGCSIILVAV